MRIDENVLVRLAKDTDGRAAKELAYLLLFPSFLFVTVSITLFAAVSSAVMILALVSMLRSREASIFKEIFFKLLFLYFFINLLSLTQTHYWSESIRGLFKVFRHVLLCVAVGYVLDTPEKIKKLYPFFFIAAAGAALDAFFQGLTGRDLFNVRPMTAYVAQSGRLTGPFRHANDFSAYLSLVGVLYLGVALDGLHFLSKKKYFLYLVGFAAVLVSLLGTYSRTGWFAFLIAAVLLAVVRRKKIVLAAVAGLVVWGIFFSPPLVKLRLSSIWDPHGGTVSERKLLWGEAIAMVKHSPFLGLGINTYSRNEHFYKAPEPAIDSQYAHNGYLQMAAEIGCLGVLSFLAALFYFLFGSLRAFWNARELYFKSSGLALVFGILAFLIHGFFDTGLQSLLLVNLMWMSLGVAWSIRRALARGLGLA